MEKHTYGEVNTLKKFCVQWNADKFGNHYKIPIHNDEYNKKSMNDYVPYLKTSSTA